MRGEKVKIKIDRNIPMPSARGGGGVMSTKYPWAKMKIGDSFIFPNTKEGMQRTQRYAGSVAAVAGYRLGTKYATRVVKENGRSIVRVWRIK
jgi:hypothetical protein